MCDALATKDRKGARPKSADLEQSFRSAPITVIPATAIELSSTVPNKTFVRARGKAAAERSQKMLLRIGERVGAPKFAGFVDIDRNPAGHALSADLEALDLRAAPRLALPGRGDPPVGLGLRGTPLGAVDQGKQVVEI